MLTVALTDALSARGVSVALLGPGWVATDMGARRPAVACDQCVRHPRSSRGDRIGGPRPIHGVRWRSHPMVSQASMRGFVIPHYEPEDMVDVEQSDAWTSAYHENGGFVRKSSEFRSDFPEGMDLGATSGRFHLYISHACPWAHRTILTRLLLGLEAHISVDVVDWRMEDDGSWVFNPEEPGATSDRIHGSRSLEDLYLRTDPTWQEDGRIGTVPVLWDREADTIVNNESQRSSACSEHWRHRGSAAVGTWRPNASDRRSNR